jgi:hypothetical protein
MKSDKILAEVIAADATPAPDFDLHLDDNRVNVEVEESNESLPPHSAPPPDPTPATGEMKRPHEWAAAKNFLRPESYRSHVPWEFRAAQVRCRWPDPELDPTFTLSEEAFDAAIAAVSE